LNPLSAQADSPTPDGSGDDASTTQRYMHLSPAAIEGAGRLAEMERPPEGERPVLQTEPGHFGDGGCV